MASILFLLSLLAALVFGAPAKESQESVQNGNFTITAGTPWQIILSGKVELPVNELTPSVNIWDIDLFNTETATIKALKEKGKYVICYFSGGTSEANRPDLGNLGSGDQGNELREWPGEHWLNLRSEVVWSIMESRIALAAAKGCNAVDPDNMDGYQEDKGGLDLTTNDSIAFVQRMSRVAKSYGLGIGLKNSIDILPFLSSDVDFAVNEQCAQLSECGGYDFFLNLGKPVFNIEYNVGSGTCANTKFSTVIKAMSLNGWVQYCDGSEYTTPIVPV